MDLSFLSRFTLDSPRKVGEGRVAFGASAEHATGPIRLTVECAESLLSPLLHADQWLHREGYLVGAAKAAQSDDDTIVSVVPALGRTVLVTESLWGEVGCLYDRRRASSASASARRQEKRRAASLTARYQPTPFQAASSVAEIASRPDFIAMVDYLATQGDQAARLTQQAVHDYSIACLKEMAKEFAEDCLEGQDGAFDRAESVMIQGAQGEPTAALCSRFLARYLGGTVAGVHPLVDAIECTEGVYGFHDEPAFNDEVGTIYSKADLSRDLDAIDRRLGRR